MGRHVTSSRMWFWIHGICNWFSNTFTVLTNEHSFPRLLPRYCVDACPSASPVSHFSWGRHAYVSRVKVHLSINLWPQRTASMSRTQQWSDICATLFNFLGDDMIGTADAYLKEVGLTWFAVRTREYYHLYTVHFKKTAAVCRIYRRLGVFFLLILLWHFCCDVYWNISIL